MALNMVIPKRVYEISVFDRGTSKHTLSLESLLSKHDDGYEFVYAIQENLLDSILYLNVGDSLFFNARRDNPNIRGLIGRIV